MTELEELRLAYAECSRQRNELLTAHKSSAERVRVLREALADAIDCVQDWGLYASPYFIEKHDLNGDVKRLRAALEATQ